MALPKRKHSKSRRDKRRTHWKLPLPSLTTCPQCGRQVVSHRACASCGSYRGRQVIRIRKKEEAGQA